MEPSPQVAHGVRVTIERGTHGAGMRAPDEVPQPPPVHADLDAVLHSETQEEPKAPAHSTRGTAPGPRGCWALNRQGQPCGAARRAEGDYCMAHSGLGVAKDPAGWSKVAAAKSAEVRRRRATLRLALGPVRLQTPRGLLKAAAFAHGEELAAAALDGAIDPAVPAAQRSRAALDLIREVEPTAQVTVSQSLPSDPEGVNELSLSALLSIAEQHGITPPSPASMLLEQHGEAEGT